MRKVHCGNSACLKWYDGDTNKVCPFCGTPEGAASAAPKTEQKPVTKQETKNTTQASEKKLPFWKKKKEEPVNVTPVAPLNQVVDQRTPQVKTEPVKVSDSYNDDEEDTMQTVPAPRSTVYKFKEEQVADTPRVVEDIPRTVDDIPRTAENIPVTMNDPKNTADVPQTGQTDWWGTAKKEVQEEAPQPARPLPEDFNTPPQRVAPVPVKRDIDDIGKTVSIYNKGGVEPVTGWLVCTKGYARGTSFPLKTGVNNVGRNVDCYINLKDPTVSRAHCDIIFEPRKKVFTLRAKESSMTYLNGDLLYDHCELNDRDVISLSDNLELVFMSFCGEKFTWEEN